MKEHTLIDEGTQSKPKTQVQLEIKTEHEMRYLKNIINQYKLVGSKKALAASKRC